MRKMNRNQQLLDACKDGDVEVAASAFENGADVESQRKKSGATALMVASEHGHVECVKLLVEQHGADMNAQKRKSKETALMLACERGHVDVVEYFFRAETKNRVEMNAQRSDGSTALIIATQHNRVRCVKVLLRHGADANLTTKRAGKKVTALRMSCELSHPECTELLLQGAGWSMEEDMLSLVVACGNKNERCAELLVQHALSVELYPNSYTAVMFACQKGHAQFLKRLLEKKQNANFIDQRGSTALFSASQNGQTECVELLLQSGASVNIRDLDGFTALHVSCDEHDYVDCVALLLKCNANVNNKDKNGVTTLQAACRKDNSKSVALLLEYKAEVNATDEEGATALMIASQNGCSDCVELLLKTGGADLNTVAEDGTTALLSACLRGSARTVHLLLDAKADMYTGDMCLSSFFTPGAFSHSVYVDASERALAGFVLMCGGYDVKRASTAGVNRLQKDYEGVHALLEQRHAEYLNVLATGAVVDTRVGRLENGLFDAPLELVFGYSGMVRKPQVLNPHQDNNNKRVLLPGSFEATKMAFLSYGESLPSSSSSLE